MSSSSFGKRDTGTVAITFQFIRFEPQIQPPPIYLKNIACTDQTLKFAFYTIATVIHDISYRMDEF